MTPRDAIGELERMGYEFTLLTGAVVRYKWSAGRANSETVWLGDGSECFGNLDDADRSRAQKLLDYLAAHKPGMISVLERRDLSMPGDLSAPGDVVKIELIGEYLAEHGYRVVRASWPEREPRPLLIVEDRV
ncbi:MAG TPA: hypothetical protein VI793_19805 [Anaerolineales bacterium]|nr:hypothetical protein [Anaerolineales bacterium]